MTRSLLLLPHHQEAATATTTRVERRTEVEISNREGKSQVSTCVIETATSSQSLTECLLVRS